jgi:hypothetical protein
MQINGLHETLQYDMKLAVFDTSTKNLEGTVKAGNFVIGV